MKYFKILFASLILITTTSSFAMEESAYEFTKHFASDVLKHCVKPVALQAVLSAKHDGARLLRGLSVLPRVFVSDPYRFLMRSAYTGLGVSAAAVMAEMSNLEGVETGSDLMKTCEAWAGFAAPHLVQQCAVGTYRKGTCQAVTDKMACQCLSGIPTSPLSEPVSVQMASGRICTVFGPNMCKVLN